MELLDWHQRYVQQARWTQDLRRYLFERAGIDQARRVLDVGCGTGALLIGQDFFGLDLNVQNLEIARQNAPLSVFAQGDALALPYADGCFDLCYCHFVLLWLQQPLKALEEMRRVTRKGGAILALAEPDYRGRIDYPPALESLAGWQRQSLRQQGADTELGRKLAGLFISAGFDSVESGVMGGQWRKQSPDQAWEEEWAVLRSDIANLGENAGVDPAQLQQLYLLDHSAREEGQRVLFVPTFYAWGRAA